MVGLLNAVVIKAAQEAENFLTSWATVSAHNMIPSVLLYSL
jgi:hypothetical protein